MLETNKLSYYGLSLAVFCFGILFVVVNGVIYAIMNISNSLTEINKVKNRLVIAAIITGAGFVLFGITLALDFNNAFN